MCGIAGMLGKEIDFRNEKEMIWKMSNSLKERGPDERGEYISRNAALIHRRLSIIDPDGGSQPMRISSVSYITVRYTILRKSAGNFDFTDIFLTAVAIPRLC